MLKPEIATMLSSFSLGSVATAAGLLFVGMQAMYTKRELNRLIKVEYLPKGSPGYKAVEDWWRQGKDDLLVSKYYPKFFNLRSRKSCSALLANSKPNRDYYCLQSSLP